MIDMTRKVRLWTPSYAAPTVGGKQVLCVCVWGGGVKGIQLERATLSLVPRPLPDFISQPWRKIGRRPGRTGNGGLG